MKKHLGRLSRVKSNNSIQITAKSERETTQGPDQKFIRLCTQPAETPHKSARRTHLMCVMHHQNNPFAIELWRVYFHISAFI